MKSLIEKLVNGAIAALPPGTLGDASPPDPAIERTRDPSHGDFATGVAMRLAKAARTNPRALATKIVAAIPPNELVAKTEIAGPGFINFFMTPAAWQAEMGRVLAEGDAYGRGSGGAGRSTIVEFVSANPTGPLHVGHGRQATFGATVANLLEADGWRVHREYYVNDAGRQMDILAASVWLRYLESCGESLPFPANGYRGAYVHPVAAHLREKHGEALRRPAAEVLAGLPPDEPQGGDKDKYIDAVIARAKELLGDEGFRTVFDAGLADMLSDIQGDLAEFGVTFGRWYSERDLGDGKDGGPIDRSLQRLRANGHVFEQDGATWFRATQFGDEKDRVVVRANGQKTYFASDIAYHLDKRERGFDLLVTILGADHHGYVARVRAGLAAMGEPPESLQVPMVQFVTLWKGGEKVAMGKREAQFVTLRDLRAEVGNDAARLIYAMRSNDQPLDFDLELAKKQSNDNPVYYIQYAHARIASVLKQAAERGLAFDRAAGAAAIGTLGEPAELALMREISRWPEIAAQGAEQCAPHLVVHYLRELAQAFHACYAALPFIVDDSETRNARLALIAAAQQVLQNALAILGVSAPESM
ncbi:MAG TPA: arginine--tRNA ligase [Steroidobacteraceae bacterium]|nr:arginine--tRNA ligase [Steroidobacteraceae bacterium]